MGRKKTGMHALMAKGDGRNQLESWLPRGKGRKKRDRETRHTERDRLSGRAPA
jgi:hypothetical protein